MKCVCVSFFLLSLLWAVERGQCREKDKEREVRRWRERDPWEGGGKGKEGWERVMFCGNEFGKEVFGNATWARRGEERAQKNDCSIETCNVCKDCW
jgi:hypothetical protein